MPTITLEAGAIRAIYLFAVLAVVGVIVCVFDPATTYGGKYWGGWLIGILGGISLGAIFGMLLTETELKQIERNGKYSMNLRDLVIASFLLCFAFAFIGRYVWSLLVFLPALIASFNAVMCGKLSAYERRAHAFIVGYWYRPVCFAVSQTSVGNLKLNPLLDLNPNSRSGARIITLLAFLLMLSLLGACYYIQIVTFDMFLFGGVAIVVSSAAFSVALNLCFKEKGKVPESET